MKISWKKKGISIFLAAIIAFSNASMAQVYAANSTEAIMSELVEQVVSSESSGDSVDGSSSSSDAPSQSDSEVVSSESASGQGDSVSSEVASSESTSDQGDSVSSEVASSESTSDQGDSASGDDSSSTAEEGPKAVERASNVIWSTDFSNWQTATGSYASYWVGNESSVEFPVSWVPTAPAADTFSLAKDTTTYKSAPASLYANSASGQSGRVDLMNLISDTDYTKDYVLRAWVKTENAASYNNNTNKGAFIRVQNNVGGSKNKATPFFKGTQDWTLVELPLEDLDTYFSAASGTLKIEIFYDTFEGEVWIDDLELVETYTLTLGKANATLVKGETLSLVTSAPVGTTVNWMSSDTSIATVDSNGIVSAVANGTATITAYTDEEHKATCTISVIEGVDSATFASMRKKWTDRLTGNPYWQGDSTDEAYKAIITTYESSAEEGMAQLNTTSATILFNDLDLDISNSFANSANSTNASTSLPYNTAILRIHNMAKVWATEGSKYYHDADLEADILYALEWMYDNCYNENLDNQAMFGNWYHWWISIPQNLAGAVIMMYDKIPADLLEKEAATLARFNEDPKYVYKVKGAAGRMDMVSGNLADTSLVSLLRGIAGNDQTAIANGTKYFDNIAGVVTSGEGIYPDGSFIQHTNLAYTGGYGATLLNGIEKLAYLVDGTPVEIEASKMDVVYDWILNGIRPLYADGAMFDMVSGRGIARPTNKDIFTGRGILAAVVLLAQNAPEQTKTEIDGFAKEQLIAGTQYMSENEYYAGVSTAAMMTSKAIVADDTISIIPNTGYAKVFGGMDKAVSHNPNFDFGISYASGRTGRFEFGNEENKTGWHQSDGATYIYNGDQSQYADDYWITVDPQRLAGITTDHSTWTLANWGNYVGNANFNGGSTVGQYGAVAMNFKNYTTASNNNLGAFKSWFIFEDEIVALGTGITGIDPTRTTETIVENKKIDGNNRLVVNGAELSLSKGTTEQLTEVDWAWLEGNNTKDSMGYYFPDGSKVNVLDEIRTGSWADINGSAGIDNTPVSKEYMSLAIPHGDNVGNTLSSFKNENYSYVLLPSKSESEVQAYAENPDIEILSNSTFVQAVRDNKANVTNYIFWGNAGSGNAVRIGDVEAEKGAVTLVKDTANHTMTIGMADVHQTNASLKFRVYGNNLSVATANDNVAVEIDKYGAILTVNTAGAKGATFEIVLNYQDLPAEQVEELAAMRKTYADNQTGNSMPDKTDADYRAVMDKYEADATTALNQLNRDAGLGTNLFNDVNVQLDWTKGNNNGDGSANLTTTTTRIKAMVLAYTSEGCTTYYQSESLKQDILFCINYIFTAFPDFANYHDRVYANWWDWSIGMPKDLMVIGILMYDELDEATRAEIYQTIQILVPSASFYWGRSSTGRATKYTATAANGAEMAMILAVNGLLGNDPASLYQASDSLSSSLKYVTSGEGFYIDGSYKQHGNFAYTGSYGVEMLRAVTLVVSITNNSTWQSTTADPNIIYEWVLNSFRPIYADGGIFDMVQGRSVSRYNRSDITSGRYAMDAILTLAENVPDQYRDQILSFAKTQTKLGTDYDASTYFAKLRFSSLIMAKKLLSDDTIPLDTEVYTKIYGSMDKAVVHGESFDLGISMFSKRNGATESINTENLKGWYTGDGALTLYNGDQNQYTNNYWATVDPLRLAGITTNHLTVPMSSNNIKVNDKTWVGGSTAGVLNFASIGQDFKTTITGSDMAAKKSWFVFGNQVVALGADITATTGDFAETIVENRKIDNNNRLFVDGIEQVATNGTETALANWAWLSENQMGSAIGYYFPNGSSLDLKRETITGTWSSVNGNASFVANPDSVTNDFISLAINHGANPTGATYSYVLIPGLDKEQTQDYAQNNQIEILANTSTVQAAADFSQGVSGYNFWNAGEVDITTNGAFAFGKVIAQNPASVTIAENATELKIGISDPTQLNTTTTVRIEGTGLDVVSNDDNIQATADNTGITIIVDTAGLSGNTSYITVSKPGPDVEINILDPSGVVIDSTTYGDTITLAANAIASTGQSVPATTVQFYLVSADSQQIDLGTAAYDGSSASIDLQISGNNWTAGANQIMAVFAPTATSPEITLSASITVIPKEVTLTFGNNTNRIYGDGLGNITVTIGGLVGNDLITAKLGQHVVTAAGTYTATVESLEGDLAKFYALPATGASIEYTISPKNLNSSMFVEIPALSYTGSALTPEVVIAESESSLLTQNDYTVAYENNINVGTGIVTITGKNNYSGTISLAFSIVDDGITSDSSSSSSSSTKESQSTPKTNDNSQLNLFLGIGVIALVALGVVGFVIIRSRRKMKNEE